MVSNFVDLDVRPALRAGEEPFGLIMAAVASLQEREGLRLIAPFKPVPLLHVLGSKGFSHEMTELDGGDWEVRFTPDGAVDAAEVGDTGAPAENAWPEPSRSLDNRDLDPPEPMVRILAAIEEMQDGEVLLALLCREPVFLFPELAKRGHKWQGALAPDGATYRILIRVGAGREAA